MDCAAPDDRSALDHYISPLLQRRREIGLPATATLFVTTSRPAGGPEHLNGIRLTQYVAFFRGEVPSGSCVPGIWCREQAWPVPFDEPFGMLWFGWDTATNDLSTMCRFTWSVDDWSREGSLTLVGWSRSSAATVTRLLQASEDFMDKTRGRPPGITDCTMDDYKYAFRAVMDRTGRRPLLVEIAAEVRQDRGTVTDNLKRKGFRDYRDFSARMMTGG